MANAPATTTSLGQLFYIYGSDKQRSGYHTTYESLLADRRQSITAVLEIGIGTLNPKAHSSMADYALPHYKPGGSLRAWRGYFPRATIWGIDTQPDTQFDEPRIRTRLADSTNPDQVDTALGSRTFDLIIDDGDHRFTSQIITLNNLQDRVKPGGCYIIEDTNETDIELFLNLTHKRTTVNPDHNLIVFHHDA